MNDLYKMLLLVS